MFALEPRVLFASYLMGAAFIVLISLWTETRAQAWREINHWIRTSHAFDGVFDFARATADPADPDRLNPAHDSGDHLHPNDAGAAALANVVPLRLFR